MDTADRWRWLLRGEAETSGSAQHLDEAMVLVTETLPCARSTSVTELDGATYATLSSSSPLALELDEAQYASGAGPCMTTARDRRLHLVRDTAVSMQFPAFADAAQRLGVRSSLSVPISTGFHPAALNIYAERPDAFAEQDRAVAVFLGRALTHRLRGSAGETPMTVPESESAARRRALVRAAQARAAAAAHPGATPEEAFVAMARRSAQERRSIYDVATDMTTTPGGSA